MPSIGQSTNSTEAKYRMPLPNSWTMRGSGGGIAYAPPQPLTRLAKRRKDLFMATILPFLRTGENVFDPKDLTAMSTALEDVCEILKLNGDSSARQTVAVRIIDLANAGERTANRLRDRVLHEAAMASRVGLDGESVGIKSCGCRSRYFTREV
jgi:hypothetical protein